MLSIDGYMLVKLAEGRGGLSGQMLINTTRWLEELSFSAKRI
jgi:hypothetical protein